MPGSIQVTNTNFDASANTQLVYSANSITMRVGGANVFTANSTQFSILVTANVTPSIQTTTGTITANTISLNSNGNIQVYGQYVLNGTITPAVLNANTSAWAPGITNTSIVRFSANSSVNLPISIFGMTAGTNGQVIILSNIGTKVVRISNEDVAETTASNRFSLPQEVLLNGYQALSVYYDGTAARWKPLDTNIITSHKPLLCKGFFAGGVVAPATFLSTAERTTYSSETLASVVGANLSQGRSSLASAGNAAKGFFMAGNAGPLGNSAVANRLNYLLETTVAVTGANLPVAKQQMAGAGNSEKGFFSGGATPATVATADRTNYSSETSAAVTGANLSQIRNQLGGVGNECKGFFSGGVSPTVALATTDRTIYSSETTSAVTGANLSQARSFLAAAGNGCKGFFVGGNAPTTVGTADRIGFFTETTAAVTGANLTQIRGGAGGAGNGFKGFFSGGTSGTAVTTTDRTNYLTETTAAVPGANLIQARSSLIGL